MTPQEVTARGWGAVDVVFVTGDAYVDHPSFGMAVIGRTLEAHGFRVGIIAQPDWTSVHDFMRLGRPNLFFGVTAGNMDSMVNHYTSNRRRRSGDAYSPGGVRGRRPDRATLAYCQRAREAYRGVPIVAGGIETSLRRLAHYDYWSDKVRRSILLDAKADLLVYGMGERGLLEILERLKAGEPVREIRDVRGTAYRIGASETAPEEDTITLQPYEQVASDGRAFAEMTRIAHLETNPHNAKRLVQYHGREAVVVNADPAGLRPRANSSRRTATQGRRTGAPKTAGVAPGRSPLVIPRGLPSRDHLFGRFSISSSTTPGSASVEVSPSAP